MTKSQELLKEIEELRTKHFQRVDEDRKELEREDVTIERREKILKEGKKETEECDKEIKDRMLRDLSSWALDPQGFFYRVNGELKVITVDIGTTGKYTLDMINFENHPKSKYRNEIVDAFINEIKQNPQDWKIEEEDNAIHDKVSWGGCFVVKHKSGRKHYRPFPLGYKKGHNLFASFSPEEWTEIENALNYQKQTDLEQLDSYKNWTKEQLISEINRLKAENEELKNNQTLTSSERQERLQKNQEKLEKFQSFLDKDALQPVNNNSFVPFLISGAVLAAVIGLVSFLVIKNLRKSKKD